MSQPITDLLVRVVNKERTHSMHCSHSKINHFHISTLYTNFFKNHAFSVSSNQRVTPRDHKLWRSFLCMCVCACHSKNDNVFFRPHVTSFIKARRLQKAARGLSHKETKTLSGQKQKTNKVTPTDWKKVQKTTSSTVRPQLSCVVSSQKVKDSQHTHEDKRHIQRDLENKGESG